MHNKIFLITFAVASLCNALASFTASIPSDAKKTFYIGERVCIPVYIESDNVIYQSYPASTGSNGYVLTNVSGNAPWLDYVHRQDYADGQELNTPTPNYHWQNNQIFWIELSGWASVAGSYSGRMLVQNTLTGESQYLNYDFSVVEPQNGLYIVSYDPAASYERQIEQRSYVLNKTGSSVTLNRPYIDYYMTKTSGKQLILNVWSKPSDACVVVLDCGSDHYVIRQRYKNDVTFQPNLVNDTFQLGINEHADIYDKYYYDNLPEKNTTAFLGDGYYTQFNGDPSNRYLDYSYLGSSINYHQRASHRNEFFNSNMTLRDNSGTIYYGTPPSWFSEGTCHILNITTETSFNQNVVRTNDIAPFCNENDFVTTPEIIFATPADTIYEGEDYFAMPVVTGIYGEIQSLEIVEQNIPWLETGSPSTYWDDYENVIGSLGLNSFAKMYYVRSINGYIRQRNNMVPGVYSYTLRATDYFGNSTTATRTVYVRDGTNFAVDKNLGNNVVSNHGVAVLMGDETWFKRYQLDIASGIVNFSNETVDLSNFIYEYYGQVENLNADLTNVRYNPHYWYPTNPNTNDLDISFTDCGNGKFRVRYQYKKNLYLEPNHSALDYKLGFVYGRTDFMDKSDDYSLTFFGEDPSRRRYNPNMPLFDKNHNLLWGQMPNWANQCNDYIGPVLSSSSGHTSSSSSSNPVFIINSSSSSKASAFRDLSVLFMDGQPTNAYYGQFMFKIANKGNSDIPIGGAEIRFYYNGDDFYDTDLLNVSPGSGNSIIAGVSKEQCGDDQYVIKVKLPNNAVAKSAAFFPEYDAVRVNVNGQNMVKNVMHSWLDVPTLTDNSKIVLLNSSGSNLYGIEPWACNGYTKKKLKLVVSGHSQMSEEYVPKLKNFNKFVFNASARIYLTIENKGDSAVSGPAFVDFQVTHPAGHIPVIDVDGKKLSVEGQALEFYNKNNIRMQVIRISAGNNHTFRFTLPNGIGSHYKQTLEFKLLDQCLFGCESRNDVFPYRWNLSDDWSAQHIQQNGADNITNNVTIYNSENEPLYGIADPSAPIYADSRNNNAPSGESLKHNSAVIGTMVPNRTDAALYSGGQILSGGDFETEWFQGWNIYEPDTLQVVKSIRDQSPQGARYISMDAGVSISQTLNQAAVQILADSGAVLTIWHKKGPAKIKLNNNSIANLEYSDSWVVDTIVLPSSSFTPFGNYVISISSNNNQKVYLDDVVLAPYRIAQPTTYATRFTNTGGEELETRAYDGDKEQLVTTSERDAMGRMWKKYLPFAMECNSVEDCNSNLKTLNNPSAAVSKYTAGNPDYPDAGKVPYVETLWKPDPMATKDMEGAPGAAFGIDSAHVVRAYSSGVNLSSIDLLDSASLNSAVASDANTRFYDNMYDGLRNSGNSFVVNYHAKKDANPTHLWELNIDQDGRKAFTVKDGEGRVIVSGSLNEDGTLLTRSVNELDARGNVIKAHPPLSCEYTNASSNCVAPSTYEYDSQSRVIKSWEPDADTTVTYYDIAGRVRATQTRQQIDSDAYSVVVYDHLDRTVYTGEWKTNRDRAAVRAYFNKVQNQNNPVVDSLTPGTVTRTFYDRVPTDDTLNALSVKLVPDGETLKYTRGRVAAVVSDVKAVLDDNGNPVPASNGKDSVIRVSTASSYDKYGRVVKAYAYDPTMPADSLKMQAVETEYDVGGKVLSTTKYPYGLKPNGMNRKITERYVYDRLGRVSDVYSKNGSGNKVPVAHYDYYPTGSVRTVKLGNSLTLSYTYHISGAVKTAEVRSADNREIYADTLYYEDCGNNACTPQYNGNISRMAHHLAHENNNYGEFRDVRYTYDELNRLTKVNDTKQDVFDEMFAYDAQGRITAQRRAGNVVNPTGGEYSYYSGKNRLKSVADNMGGTADERNMSDTANFVYDSVGNLTYDKSKGMEILYDWRGMPIEFIQQSQPTGSSDNSLFRLLMEYDGTGRRISKTVMRKVAGAADWDTTQVTHYTGIGTEIRENYAGPAKQTKVVVNMPQGLGRYGIEDAENPDMGSGVGYIPNTKFEWYLKNHLGSTMLVYGTQADANPTHSDIGTPLAAYDYRAFGEMVELTPPPTGKVTENFTGKEHDDEIALDYFGARYLDPMLGMWISVDPARQFASPYLYAGNGLNPVNGVDLDGNVFNDYGNQLFEYMKSTNFNGSKTLKFNMTRAHDDPDRYFNIKPVRISKIEPSAHNKPGFKKTYDVYFPVDMNADGTDLSIITYITAGHELNHPYTLMKAGHNDVGNVKTEKEFLDNLKKMANEPEPDKIYLDDYNSAKEMGVYDDE